MAAAMARGWAGEVEVDAVHRFRAPGGLQSWPREVGGEAAGSNAELAERADLVVLAVKPAMLEQAAAELAGRDGRSSRSWGDTAGDASLPPFPSSEIAPGYAQRRGRGSAGGALRRRRGDHRGSRDAGGARACRRAARCGVRCRHRGDGLRARLSGPCGRGDRRCGGQRRAWTRSWPGDWSSRRRPAPRSCCAFGIPPMCAGPSPRPEAAPRPGWRRSIARALAGAFEAAVQASLERMRG